MDQQECGWSLDPHSQDGTQTLPVAQHDSFSPALGSWDTFAAAPKAIARCQHHICNWEEAGAYGMSCPALTALRDSTSTKVDSATDTSWGNSSHDNL